MGCNCKKDKNGEDITKKKINESKNSFFIKILIFIVKLIVFLMASVIATVIVIPFSIFLLVKVIFLDGSADLTNTLMYIGNKLKKKEDIDEEEEIEITDDDEITLLNSEE